MQQHLISASQHSALILQALHISGTLYQFTLSASVPVFSTFVSAILPTKGGDTVKRDLQTIMCELSVIVDQLICLIQMLEDICIELDGD